MFKRGLDAARRQFVEHVAFVASVLETLEIIMNPCTNIAVPCANDNPAATTGKRYGAGETGRTRTDDRDGLGLVALSSHPARKRTHAGSHGSRT